MGRSIAEHGINCADRVQSRDAEVVGVLGRLRRIGHDRPDEDSHDAEDEPNYAAVEDTKVPFKIPRLHAYTVGCVESATTGVVA